MTDDAPKASVAHEVEDAIKEALSSDLRQRRLWYTAAFSVVAFLIAFMVCRLVHHPESAVASGLVAMFAVVGAGVVPRGMTLQVGIPAALCVFATLPLTLVSDRRPIVATLVTAAVVGLAALSHADSPVGKVSGVMASMAFVLGLAGRSLHDVPLSESLFAAAIAAVAAALCISLLMAWRWFGGHEKSKYAIPLVPKIPGSLWHRYLTAVGGALRNWRDDPDVRLAFRRVLVMAPLAGALEWWGNPDGLYTLLAAYAATQSSMRETRNSTLAQVAGTAVACLAAVAVGLVVHGQLLFLIGLLGMAFGLAFVMRNQFISAAGTIAFALAGAGMSGGITYAATGRFVTTLAGSAIGLVGTLLVRPPRATSTSG